MGLSHQVASVPSLHLHLSVCLMLLPVLTNSAILFPDTPLTSDPNRCYVLQLASFLQPTAELLLLLANTSQVLPQAKYYCMRCSN